MVWRRPPTPPPAVLRASNLGCMRRTLPIALLLCLVCASVALAKTTKTVSAVEKSSGGLGYSKSTITVKHGKVTLKMGNPSSLPHGVGVTGHGIDKDGKTVGKGGTSTVTVSLKKGTYTFYCHVPGHRAAGMKGKLIVS